MDKTHLKIYPTATPPLTWANGLLGWAVRGSRYHLCAVSAGLFGLAALLGHSITWGA